MTRLTGTTLSWVKEQRRAIEVADADYPEVFKSAKDAKIKDYNTFFLKAEGDYNEEENKAIEPIIKKLGSPQQNEQLTLW